MERRYISFILFIIIFLCIKEPIFAEDRNFINDVNKILPDSNSLTAKESIFAYYIFVYYYTKFEKIIDMKFSISEASEKLTNEQYNFLLNRVAIICKSKAVKNAIYTNKMSDLEIKKLILELEKSTIN